MINEHRKAFIKRYGRKLLSPGGWRKVLADPRSAARTVATFVSNRNLRTVPADELLRDAEAAVHALARMSPPAEADRIETWLPVRSSEDTAELGRLLQTHGSDKSTEHDYFEVYGSILHGRRARPLRILEIGLGTNNLAFQSNMGLGGRPGASLRAFRDWAPNAEIVGADIDRGILFAEERIVTHWVDQTDPAALGDLASKAGGPFDLIIDDGLHLPHANFNTIEALLPLLAPDGTMVIEDIDPIHLHYWRVAARTLDRYDTILSERRGGWIFVIRGKG